MEAQANLFVYSYYEEECPIYRIWINDQVYIERPFWIDCLKEFINEVMFFELEPGEHTITLEKVFPSPAKIWAEKFTIKYRDKKNVFEFPVNPQDKQIIKFKIE